MSRKPRISTVLLYDDTDESVIVYIKGGKEMNNRMKLSEEELDQVVGGVYEEPGILHIYRCTNEISDIGICNKNFLSNADCGPCPKCGCTDSSKRIRID